jgi:hypothetical protein
MKRTGFKPRTKPLKHGTRPMKNSHGFALADSAKLVPIEPRRVGPEFRYGAPQVAALFKPIEKFNYVRSPELMALYRKPSCQWCGSYDGVCGAHSNWAIHGKGRSIKASDQFCASLCTRCHRELDQGNRLTETQRQALWWAAHVNTVRWLVTGKLWPASVPVPTDTIPDEWL